MEHHETPAREGPGTRETGVETPSRGGLNRFLASCLRGYRGPGPLDYRRLCLRIAQRALHRFGPLSGSVFQCWGVPDAAALERAIRRQLVRSRPALARLLGLERSREALEALRPIFDQDAGLERARAELGRCGVQRVEAEGGVDRDRGQTTTPPPGTHLATAWIELPMGRFRVDVYGAPGGGGFHIVLRPEAGP